MAKNEFWFTRMYPPDVARFKITPKNWKGILFFVLFFAGFMAFLFGASGSLILGYHPTAYMLYGLGALFLLGGFRLMWVKTDPDPNNSKFVKRNNDA